VAANMSMLVRTTVLSIEPASEGKLFKPLKLNCIGSEYKSDTKNISLARCSNGFFFKEAEIAAFKLLPLPLLKNSLMLLLKSAPIFTNKYN
jgi:hypothetical protein